MSVDVENKTRNIWGMGNSELKQEGRKIHYITYKKMCVCLCVRI